MVYAFGSASFLGSTQGLALASSVVGMAQTANGAGYWLVAEDGGVFGYNAPFFGSAASFPHARPAVAMGATADGGGYWIVTDDGAVYSFGSAQYFGGLTNLRLSAPITDLIPTAGGHGYWLIAKDGGVFSFGDAGFFGSTGGMRLNAPVVSMAPTADGLGYWLVARDGGVFSFGERGVPRFDRRHALERTRHRHGIGQRRRGLLARRRRRWRLLLRLRAVLRQRGRGVAARARRDATARHAGWRRLPHARRHPAQRRGDGGHGRERPGGHRSAAPARGAGYWTGGANGVFGPLTQQAVWAFQKINGLNRSGVVDDATRIAFRTAQRPTPRSTSGYVAEVDKGRQVVIIANNGHTNWVFNTSTGTDRMYTFEGHQYLADTPTGHFVMNRQIDGVRVGQLGTLYRPKYFHPDGIAFHGYPSVPPYPASHGCVRLSNAAINFVWDANIIPLGTAVWVY